MNFEFLYIIQHELQLLKKECDNYIYNKANFKEYLAKVKLCIPSQSYGTRLEKFIIDIFGYTKVKNKIKRGDCKDKNNDHYEIKVSYLSKKDAFSIVQIRKQHNIQFYLLVFIEAELYKSYDDVKIRYFKVPSDILYAMKLGTAHGSKKDKHANKENRLTIPKDSDDLRTLEQYEIYAP